HHPDLHSHRPALETTDRSNAIRNDTGHDTAPRGQKGETEMRTRLYPFAAVMIAAGSAQTAPAIAAGTSADSPPPVKADASSEDTAIRPFRVIIPDEKLTELRRRILATQWPEKETVADQSQGVPLATMQALARYWATEYDWRKVEAKLKAL